MSEENKPRTPLKPLSEAERVALAHDRGLDFDNLPRELNLTEAERAAAVPVPPGPQGELAAPQHNPVDPPPRKSVIPEKWAKVTGGLGFLLAFAVFLPFPPWSTAVALLGAALTLLSGGALPQFSFLAGKPILTGTALAVCGAIAEQGIVYVYHLPPGLPFNIGFLLLTVLCFLTGKAAPQPTKKA